MSNKLINSPYLLKTNGDKAFSLGQVGNQLYMSVTAKPATYTGYQTEYVCSRLRSSKFVKPLDGCFADKAYPSCLRTDDILVNIGPGPKARTASHRVRCSPGRTCYVHSHTLFCGQLLRESECKTVRRGGCFYKDTEFLKRSGSTSTATRVSDLVVGNEIEMFDTESATAKTAFVLGFAVQPSSTCYDAEALAMFPFINIAYQINGDLDGISPTWVVSLNNEELPRYVTNKTTTSSFGVTPAHSIAVVRAGSLTTVRASNVSVGDVLPIWDGTDLAYGAVTSVNHHEVEWWATATSAYLPITDKGMYAVLAGGAVVPMDAEIVVDNIRVHEMYVHTMITFFGQLYGRLPLAIRDSLVGPLMAPEPSELYGACVQSAAVANIWIRLLRKNDGKLLKLVETIDNFEEVLDLVKDEIIASFFPSWANPPSFVKGILNSALVLGLKNSTSDESQESEVRWFDLFRDSFEEYIPIRETDEDQLQRATATDEELKRLQQG